MEPGEAGHPSRPAIFGSSARLLTELVVTVRQLIVFPLAEAAFESGGVQVLRVENRWLTGGEGDHFPPTLPQRVDGSAEVVVARVARIARVDFRSLVPHGEGMRSLVCFSVVAGLVNLVASARAQSPEKPERKLPLSVANGGFERSYGVENPWTGVNSKGKLDSFRAAVPVLTESGAIGKTPMPVSVAIHDMNNDGLPDLVTGDPKGYVRIYFNQGTPTEPKYTTGELAQAYLSQPVEEFEGRDYTRLAPRVSVAELGGSPQLLIGNYFGEIFILPNKGSAQQPSFAQPPDLTRLMIPTTAKGNARWGNVFAPVMIDWNNDGKQDILIGEGSYSANNIHLAINEGTNGSPKFSENNRHVLAFGDGREQLTPAVVDYNADGRPDLLVGARDGKIGVYLQTDQPWEPGVELPFASFLSGGGKPLAARGITTIAAGDLNGDKKFDVVVGQADGNISYALNTGTLQEPKFDALKEFGGATPFPAMRWPSGWDVSLGLERGNNLAFVSVVDEEPAEGKSCLKIGYVPNPNVVMPSPLNVLPARGNFDLEKGYNGNFSANELMESAPSNLVMLRQRTPSRLKIGDSYTLSFMAKGNQVSDAEVSVIFDQSEKIGEDQIVRGDRGRATVKRQVEFERVRESEDFSVGSTWREVKSIFTPRFKSSILNKLDATRSVDIEIIFELKPGDGVLYIDDVKLTKN